MVMVERDTRTVFTHIEGRGVQGPFEGEQLEILPLVHTTLGKWKELHPDTTVLDPNTPYTDQYARPVTIGSSRLGAGFARSLLNVDDRLPGNELVLGVQVGSTFVAYQFAILEQEGDLVKDTIEGQALVVFADAQIPTALAFVPIINGESLTFVATAENGVFRDQETGSAWTVEGRAVSGPLNGESLTYVASFVTEWYGWSAYHPSTNIYQP
jgi:hypothetical protein